MKNRVSPFSASPTSNTPKGEVATETATTAPSTPRALRNVYVGAYGQPLIEAQADFEKRIVHPCAADNE